MIHKNLKRLRTANKLTQQQVADYLMISSQSISKWEKGEALPSVEFLPKIAKLFNCSVNAFFSDYEAEIFEGMANRDVLLEETNELAWTIIDSLLGDGSAEQDLETLNKYPELSIPVEVMFLPALVELLNDNAMISFLLLQNKLGVSYYIASKIIESLCALGVVIFEDCTYRIVKENIKLLDSYLPKK